MRMVLDMTVNSLPPELTPIPGIPMRDAPPRSDLFWPSGMWAGGTELSWESRQVAAQTGTLAAWDGELPEQDRIVEVANDAVALDLLAVIQAWGSVTVEQLYALAGHELRCDDVTVWGRMPRPVRRLFAAQLVARGVSVSPASTLPIALRCTTGRSPKRLLRLLDAEQLAWVTGGRPWAAASRGDRHNLLATELALQIGENAYVQAVAGPAQSSHHDLDRTGRTPLSRRSADLTVHSTGSMRWAIEVTCSANPAYLRRKIDNWCALLASARADELNLGVIFVDAANPYTSTPNEVWRPLARFITESLRSHPAAAFRGVKKRIACARWSSWLSADGPSDGLAILDGSTSDGRGGWDAFDVVSFGPPPSRTVADARTEAVRQSAGCPAILRADL